MKATAAGLTGKALRDGNRAAVGDFVAKQRKYLTGKVLDFGCGKQPYKHLVDGEYVGFDTDYGRKSSHNLRLSGRFDAILITAACPEVPAPLIEQLNENGRLVVPVGPLHTQELLLLKRVGGRIIRKNICPCRFVPLFGEYAFKQ